MRQQGKKKILPNKLQFDLQKSKNKKIKKKPKRPKSKWSRMTKSVKVVKWDSMENLRVNCEYCIDSLSLMRNYTTPLS